MTGSPVTIKPELKKQACANHIYYLWTVISTPFFLIHAAHKSQSRMQNGFNMELNAFIICLSGQDCILAMNTVVSLEELSIYEAVMNVMRATGSCMPAGENHTASEGAIGAEVYNPACQLSQQAFHLSRQAFHQPFPLSKHACPPSEQA